MAKVTSVQIIDNSEEVLKAMKEQVLLGLEAVGHEAEGYAKDECPVHTGTLRNSITHEVIDEDFSVHIGTNEEYAVYVEYGEKARHTTGRAHFLRDSAANHSERYKNIMEAFLRA